MYGNDNHEEYLDFLTYVLIHTASADEGISEMEADAIKRKASNLEFDQILKLYKTHSQSDRTEYLKKMTGKWLQTDDSRKGMLEKVQRLTGIDLDVDEGEKAVYRELKEIIL